MRRYGFGLCILVACFAGSYVFIYLYRWEWNRALMSAALFLVAEVALIGAIVMDRLRRIDAKLDANARGEPIYADDGQQSVGRAESFDFPWLRASNEPADRFGVFIPVLMGAGVALSGLAWLVERIARGVTRSAGGPSTRKAHEVLTLPAGGPFMSEAMIASVPGTPSNGRPRRGLAITVGALALVAPGVFLLADLTQSRPDPPTQATANAITLEAQSNQPWSERLTAKVNARWAFCAEESNRTMQVSQLHAADGQRFVGVVSPALGERAARRFVGCLEDAAVDFVLLDVVSVEDVGRAG